MSDRQCNYCLFEILKKEAESQDKKIETKHSPAESFPNGVDIFIDDIWVCWYAKLGSECGC